MTLPPYTKSREGEVQEQGFEVSNGAHPVRSRPVEASSERMERARSSHAQPKGQQVRASRGQCGNVVLENGFFDLTG
jgi:hypothetical protein